MISDNLLLSNEVINELNEVTKNFENNFVKNVKYDFLWRYI